MQIKIVHTCATQDIIEKTEVGLRAMCELQIQTLIPFLRRRFVSVPCSIERFRYNSITERTGARAVEGLMANRFRIMRARAGIWPA